MTSDSENESPDNHGTSPGPSVQGAVEMTEELDTLKDLKRKRTAAKTKFTIHKDAILSSLRNPDTPAARVTAGEREFQNAFKILSDAHSQYMGTRYPHEEDPEPTDAAYMVAPIAGCQEVKTDWAIWCSAREKA